MDINIEDLPDEIIIRILHFLGSQDLISVSCVSNRLSAIVSDRDIVRDLDLRSIYKCTTEDLKLFFLPRKRCHNIQHINLEHVYWIKVPNFVVKLKSLVSLKMKGIPLTFLQLKWILTSCSKIQDLSISWPDDMESENRQQWIGGFEEVADILNDLKSLQILIYSNPAPILELLTLCKGLRKLSISNHHARCYFSTPRDLNSHKYKLDFPHLEELVIDHADGAFPFSLIVSLIDSISQGYNSSAEWKTYWINTEIQMDTEHVRRLGSFVLSKCSTLFLALTPYFREMVQETGILHNLTALSVKGQTPVTTNLSNIISSCPKLKCLNVLFGLNVTVDTRKVSEKLPKLERLSICCQPEHGPPKIVNGIALLHNLTHLTVPVCALIEKLPDKEIKLGSTEAVYTGSFKKRRVGVPQHQSSASLAAFNLVFDNCPLIVMLEIGFNTSTSCSPAKVLWECLENIKKLKRLTHLTLDGVPITNGNFLIGITRECTSLEFLRLRSLGPSGKCVYLSHLIQALAYCKSLVNLRIQQNYLAPGTTIFKALEECSSLQRVFISSERDTQALDLNALRTLIDKQTNLVFVFVVGANTTKEKCTSFTRKYKKSVRPALVVRVRNILYDVFDDKNTDNRTTPACHYNEMVTFRSWAFESVA
ncbi:uncharacterized protein LOC122245772 isoform X3 [Penaeus japonicus]|uniref:uncharacterized protein LOC122245772 isoform X3 n=1 Tax=Penaeus japonicus TaxID=27405 RepID=UPI001C71109E|nr:uncharacterized protein LOC122245772 isoform X3 [Penaeus japonicus]